MEEIWRDITGYEGLYQVSNLGRVKSNYNKNGKTILKNRVNCGGYCTVLLSKNKKSKNFSVHRLVASLFIHNADAKLFVNHKNGIKKNNEVTNLEWVTTSENQKHAYETGLQPKNFRTKRKVKCIETGEIFESLTKAGISIKINNSRQGIGRACKGELKRAFGYHWQYYTEQNLQEI